MPVKNVMQTATHLPEWASCDWESERQTSFFPSDENVAFTVWEDESVWTTVKSYRVRLFINQTFVAAARILGPGNSDVPDGSILCCIEVRPEFRGKHLSVRLMDFAKELFGEIYSSGTYSKAGYANAKYLGLPLIPWVEMSEGVVITDTENYSFIKWEERRFKTMYDED